MHREPSTFRAFAEDLLNRSQTAVESAIAENLPEIIEKQKKRLFDNSGAINDREAWADNAPDTIRKKKSSKPLIETGELSSSFHVYYENGKIIMDIEWTPKHGNKDEVLALLDEGGTVKLGKTTVEIPARPFLNFTDGDINEIAMLLGEKIAENLRQVYG